MSVACFTHYLLDILIYYVNSMINLFVFVACGQLHKIFVLQNQISFFFDLDQVLAILFTVSFISKYNGNV